MWHLVYQKLCIASFYKILPILLFYSMTFVISFHIHLGWWKSAYINLMACTGASWDTIFRRCLPDISYKRHICCGLEITSLALFIFTQLWIKTDKDNYMIVSERHLRLHYASHSDIYTVLSALHSKRMSSHVEPWLDFLRHLFFVQQYGRRRNR